MIHIMKHYVGITEFNYVIFAKANIVTQNDSYYKRLVYNTINGV